MKNQVFRRIGVCHQKNQVKLIHRLTRKSLFEDIREFGQYRKILAIKKNENKVREVCDWDSQKWESVISVLVSFEN